VGEVVVDAVGDGAVVVERGVDLADRGEDRVDPADVEEGLLLTGEGGVGEVLGGGGGERAHLDAARPLGIGGRRA
jgi:hypothetical protein